MHKGFVLAKNSLLAFILAAVVCSVALVGGVSATHTVTVDLQPEWSPAGQLTNYGMEVCNDQGSDHIDEVRVIKNPQYSTFDCVDKSGDGWVTLKVSPWYDSELGMTEMCWYYTLDPNNNIPDGSCETFEFSATVPNQGCDFVWKIETRDEKQTGSGNYETWSDTTSVDDMEPIIIKHLGDPKMDKDGYTWITQSTPITIEAYDEGDCGISGIYKCEYRYDVDGSEVLPWTQIQWQRVQLGNPPHYFYTFYYKEDSVHDLEIRCYDVAGNMKYHSQTEKVDSTPPETEKTYGDPSFPADINTGGAYPHFITTSTPITLKATDGGKICAIDVEKTWYYDVVVSNVNCEYENECVSACPSPYEVMYEGDLSCAEFAQGECEDVTPWDTWADCVEANVNRCVSCDGDWKLYRGEPIYKPEESCHIIQFLSADYIGNYEKMQTQCVFVEDKPPEMIKKVGEPFVYCEDLKDPECDYYVRDHVTEITLDCDDSWNGEADHPVDHETMCYRMSFDVQPWLTEQYCRQFGGDYTPGATADDGWCCVDVSNEAEYKFTFQEDSLHDLEFFCIDALGNYNEIPDYELFKVDSQPPIIEKDMFGSYLGDCPSGTDIEHGDCYVADDSTSGVDITVYDDETYGCAVDDLQCYYKLWWEATRDECASAQGQWNESSGWCLVDYNEDFSDYAEVIFHEDSNHELYIYCEDALGNWVEDTEYFLVDSTPPVTEKEYGEPQKIEPFCAEWCYVDYCTDIPAGPEKDECSEECAHAQCTMWITSDTEVTLTAEDEKVGVDKIYWRNLWFPANDEICNRPPHIEIPRGEPEAIFDECNPTYIHENYVGDLPDFQEYKGPFTKPEESCHVIEYYSVDKLGNEEMLKYQCVFVDNTPPLSVKMHGTPFVEGDGYDFVTTETPIGLSCEDQLPHPVGQETIYWRFSTYDNPDFENPTYDPADEWYSGPGAVKASSSSMAFSSTGWGGWSCPEGTFVVGGGYEPYPADHPVAHSLAWKPGACVDSVCWPNTPFGYTYSEGETGWIVQNGGEAQVLTVYAMCAVPLTFPEDCWHDLEYYCVDHLGNDERDLLGGEPNRQFYAVDTVAPEITKTIVGPSEGQCPPENKEDICYIDGVTNISVDVTDPEPHPVDQVWCDWGYWWKDTYYGPFRETVFPFVISGWEESEHTLDIYCEDALGNQVEDTETFYVDKTPPTIHKWYGEPYFNPAIDIDDSEPWVEYISSETPIYIHVEETDEGDDAQPHPSGVKEVKYRITMLGDDDCFDCGACKEMEGSGDWTDFTGYDDPMNNPIYITEDSCHLIEIYAVDNVGKDILHKQCVIVDNQAPEPDKTVGEPKWKWDGSDAYYYEIGDKCWKNEQGDGISDVEACRADDWCIECWRTTLLTPIYLECEDPEPHPVDHETVCFNVEWDAVDVTDDYCDGDLVYNADYEKEFCCVDHEMVFNFGETTEHELEYYCEDALGNTGEILDVEKFKVEDTAFNITLNKKWNLISFPVFLLEENPEAVFYHIKDKVMGVWTYDPTYELCGDLWCAWFPGDAGSNLEEILPGWGYWVLMDDGAVLTIGGSLMKPGPVGMASKEIVPGWNLIGYYGADNMTEYVYPDGNGGHAYCELYSLGEDLLDKEFAGLWTYWEPLNPYQWLELDNMDNMDPGAGYWLSTPQEGLYTPTTSCGVGDLFNPHEIN